MLERGSLFLSKTRNATARPFRQRGGARLLRRKLTPSARRRGRRGCGNAAV